MIRRYQLQHDRSLINQDFQGYRLKNRVLKKVSKRLPYDVLTYDLTKMAENSLNRTKLFSQSSSLVLDHFSKDGAYYIGTNLRIYHVNLSKISLGEDSFLEKFIISSYLKEEISTTNYISLAFADPNFAVLSVNNFIILLKTGCRDEVNVSWTVAFRYNLDEEFQLSQFQISSAVVRGGDVEVAFITSRTQGEIKFQDGLRGCEIFVINFKNKYDMWSCERKQRIFGKSMPDLVVLDGTAENPGLFVISSSDKFCFIDSTRKLEQISEETNLEQPDERVSIQQRSQIQRLLEEVDLDSTEDVHILRFDLMNDCLGYQISYDNSRFIGSIWEAGIPANFAPVPSICLQYDVDAVVFCFQYETATWKHCHTLDAFSYVQLGKTGRRFTKISNDYTYGAICDSTSSLFVYNKEVPLAANTVLTNRTNRQEFSSSAEFYVASFECGQLVEDMIAFPQYAVLLFKKMIVIYLV